MPDPVSPVVKGTRTSEWNSTVVGAVVAVTAMLSSTSVEVQVAALYSLAAVVVGYSISRAIAKLAK